MRAEDRKELLPTQPVDIMDPFNWNKIREDLIGVPVYPVWLVNTHPRGKGFSLIRMLMRKMHQAFNSGHDEAG